MHADDDFNDDEQQVQIHIPPETQRGVYANQTFVTHSQEEFILDFILGSPPMGILNARVIVSPGHAKRLAATLMDNIAKYEAMFGEIPQPIMQQEPDSPRHH